MAGLPVPPAIPPIPTDPDPTSIKGWKTSLTQFDRAGQDAVRKAMAAKNPPIMADDAINAQLVKDVEAADELSKAYHVLERQYGQVKSNADAGREKLNQIRKLVPAETQHQIYGVILTDITEAIGLAER
jgi:hypothetical protein